MKSRHRSFDSILALSLVMAIIAPPGIAKGKTPWDEHIDAGQSALVSGDYASAERNLNAAMEDTRKFKDDDVRLGSTFFQMGELNVRLQNYTLAKNYYQRALAVQQKLLGAESMEAANSLYGLALCEQQTGNHLGAEIFLKRVDEIWKKKLGPKDPKLISILPSMASYAAMKNNLPAAETYYKQLVDISQASGNKEQEGSYLNLLATTLGNEGKYSEAKNYASRAVEALKNGDSSIALDSAKDNLRIVERKVKGEIAGADDAAKQKAEIAEQAKEQAREDAKEQHADRLMPQRETK